MRDIDHPILLALVGAYMLRQVLGEQELTNKQMRNFSGASRFKPGIRNNAVEVFPKQGLCISREK
jgi:hypothetical protein